MIRILFVHHQLVCGGAEQALFDLCCLLDKKRFHITVMAQNIGGIWEEKFKKAGINVIFYDSCQVTSKNPFIKVRNFLKRKTIYRTLNNNGKDFIDKLYNGAFDIIVSYHVWEHPLIGFAKKAKSIKYIHGDVDTNPSFKVSMMKIKNLFPEFDKIICVSKNSFDSFTKLIQHKDNVEFHYNPLNSERVIELSNKLCLDNYNVPSICAVGRLSKEKGFFRLVEIHKRLIDKGILHKLILVGDGEEKEKILSYIKLNKIEDSVDLIGYTDNPYPYIRNCDFLVNSSYTEGLPVVAMEALCLGTPIVAAVPSIRELFDNDICGIITDNDDESLESGIEKMLIDSEFYEKAKSGAIKRSEYFNGKRMVSEIEELFVNIIN